MLFRAEVLDRIRAGRVTLAFRRWRRPSVRTGGTLLTAIGQLRITSVTRIDADQISEQEARRAGYESRSALLNDLRRGDGTVYRIELGDVRADPRIALRAAAAPGEEERRTLLERLRRLDCRAAAGPWTLRTLAVIDQYPAVRAGDLCERVGQDKLVFKVNVRKLKALGLTQSLETGYRLSARGEALLRVLRSQADGG